MLHIESCDVDELGRTATGEGREMISGECDGVEIVQRRQQPVWQGGDTVVLHVELFQQDRVGQRARNGSRLEAIISKPIYLLISKEITKSTNRLYLIKSSR